MATSIQLGNPGCHRAQSRYPKVARARRRTTHPAPRLEPLTARCYRPPNQVPRQPSTPREQNGKIPIFKRTASIPSTARVETAKTPAWFRGNRANAWFRGNVSTPRSKKEASLASASKYGSGSAQSKLYSSVVNDIRQPKPPEQKRKRRPMRPRSPVSGPLVRRERFSGYGKPTGCSIDKTAGTVVSKRDFVILRKLFLAMDDDQNGTVDLLEYCTHVESSAPALLKEARHMFTALSIGGETVTFVQLVKAAFPLIPIDKITVMLNKHTIDRLLTTLLQHFPPRALKEKLTALQKVSTEEKEEIRAIVGTWDDNGNGRIDKKELSLHARNAQAEVGQEEIDGWFAQYDVGNKGELTFEEAMACLATSYADDD